MQLTLRRAADDDLVDTGKVHELRLRKPLAEQPRPGRIAGPAGTRRRHRAGDHPRSRLQMLREATGDAEADDAAYTARDGLLDRAGQRRAVACARKNLDGGTGGDAGLEGKSC